MKDQVGRSRGELGRGRVIIANIRSLCGGVIVFLVRFHMPLRVSSFEVSQRSAKRDPLSHQRPLNPANTSECFHAWPQFLRPTPG
eukprot:1311595-Amphidinium_carterae.1